MFFWRVVIRLILELIFGAKHLFLGFPRPSHKLGEPVRNCFYFSGIPERAVCNTNEVQNQSKHMKNHKKKIPLKQFFLWPSQVMACLFEILFY